MFSHLRTNGMSPLWTQTGNGAAKDHSSFMRGQSLPCWLRVTSSMHQLPSKSKYFHRHHHPHSRCGFHSSQHGDMLQIAPPAKILHAFELSLKRQIHLHLSPDTNQPTTHLHGQRFLRGSNILVLPTPKHASSKSRPHNQFKYFVCLMHDWVSTVV